MPLWPFYRPATVFWTLCARRQLDRALSGSAAAYQQTLKDIAGVLRRCFPPSAKQIVVHALYQGYRPNPEEFVLQTEVEVCTKGELSVQPFVVKVFLRSSQPRLAAEWKAWTSCRPIDFVHDAVLMSLHRVPEGHRQVIALKYSDARNAIDTSLVVPLEKVVLDSVLFDNPPLHTVRNVLVRLFERLEALLHRYAQLHPPEKQSPLNRLPASPPVAEYVLLWNDPAADAHPSRFEVRQLCENGGTTVPGMDYRDPAAYLESIQAKLAAGDYFVDPSPQQTKQPLIPPFLQGKAHGDLHGLNILVGITEEGEAISPALFDYEKMSNDLPVALDFVKLETELKIRALVRIYERTPAVAFIPQVQQLEHLLHCWTLHYNDGDRWPQRHEVPDLYPPAVRALDSGPAQALPLSSTSQLRRLLAVLLEVRHRASLVLGKRGPGDWFRQYLFWMLVYGVRVVRFKNLKDNELIAAYLSAGVAAGRLCPLFLPG